MSEEDSHLSPHSRLSTRERAVVMALADGCTQSQAARALHISERAVKGRVRYAKERLGCATTAQLMFLLGREAGAAGRHR